VKTFGTEFWKFNHKRSLRKCKNCSQNFHVLRLQTVITPQWLQIARSLYRMPSFHFYHSNHFKVFPLGSMLRTKKILNQIFVTVQCPILRIKTNGMLQCWCGVVSDILKKSRLNSKPKISNKADNTGITQSQARDTRYRQMQELNRLCVSK